MNILDINSQNYTIMHWLNILINNRIFDCSTPLEREAKRYITQEFNIDTDKADIIKGYRADDSYFSYARDFISGIISYEQLCKAIVLGNLGEQICLKSKKVFGLIRFSGYQKVDYNEWYLAYYQWYTGKSFRIIQKEVPIERIRDMYNPYHEMDISQSVDRIIEICDKTGTGFML